MKQCTKCQLIKAPEMFSKGNAKDGLRYWCRQCCKESKLLARLLNKEKVSEQMRMADKRYKERHPETYKEVRRRYYEKIISSPEKHQELKVKVQARRSALPKEMRRQQDMKKYCAAKANPERWAQRLKRQSKVQKRNIEKLTDSVVRNYLKTAGISRPPPEVVEGYRMVILLKRKLKELSK